MVGNRVIVDASVHDAFVERFVERARALKVGDPSDPQTNLGPVINGRQPKGIVDKVKRARNNRAAQLLGGDPIGPAGLALPPHVLMGTNNVPTASEEVFGPVITIIRAEDERHALTIANDTEYGLSSAVYTSDAERGVRFALQVEAGMTHVNDVSVEDEPHLAFGGEKQSGLGRFGGPMGGQRVHDRALSQCSAYGAELSAMTRPGRCHAPMNCSGPNTVVSNSGKHSLLRAMRGCR